MKTIVAFKDWMSDAKAAVYDLLDDMAYPAIGAGIVGIAVVIIYLVKTQ